MDGIRRFAKMAPFSVKLSFTGVKKKYGRYGIWEKTYFLLVCLQKCSNSMLMLVLEKRGKVAPVLAQLSSRPRLPPLPTPPPPQSPKKQRARRESKEEGDAIIISHLPPPRRLLGRTGKRKDRGKEELGFLLPPPPPPLPAVATLQHGAVPRKGRRTRTGPVH